MVRCVCGCGSDGGAVVAVGDVEDMLSDGQTMDDNSRRRSSPAIDSFQVFGDIVL